MCILLFFAAHARKWKMLYAYFQPFCVWREEKTIQKEGERKQNRPEEEQHFSLLSIFYAMLCCGKTLYARFYHCLCAAANIQRLSRYAIPWPERGAHTCLRTQHFSYAFSYTHTHLSSFTLPTSSYCAARAGVRLAVGDVFSYPSTTVSSRARSLSVFASSCTRVPRHSRAWHLYNQHAQAHVLCCSVALLLHLRQWCHVIVDFASARS